MQTWNDLPIGTIVENTYLSNSVYVSYVLERIPDDERNWMCTCGSFAWNAWNGICKVHVCPKTEVITALARGFGSQRVGFIRFDRYNVEAI